MNQNENRRKEKANRDAQAVLGYIYYQTQNMCNPLNRELDTSLKNQNITEDYFQKTEHYTILKDR